MEPYFLCKTANQRSYVVQVMFSYKSVKLLFFMHNYYIYADYRFLSYLLFFSICLFTISFSSTTWALHLLGSISMAFWTNVLHSKSVHTGSDVICVRTDHCSVHHRAIFGDMSPDETASFESPITSSKIIINSVVDSSFVCLTVCDLHENVLLFTPTRHRWAVGRFPDVQCSRTI